jgi:hypothetical protein
MRPVARDLVLVILDDRLGVGSPRQVPIMQPDPCAQRLFSGTGNLLAVEPPPNGSRRDTEKLRGFRLGQFEPRQD